jgi:toxin ParE1/3/4
VKYHVEITEPAETDIAEAAAYIQGELQNPSAAVRLLDDIDAAVYSLEEMPARYARVKDEELAALGFRFVSVHNYLLFYIIREKSKKVVIERFLYGRRDWLSILKGEAPE